MDEMGLSSSGIEDVDDLLAAVTTLGGAPLDSSDVRDLTVGDRNALLLGVLATSYERRLSWLLACRSCGEQLDVDIDVADLFDVEPLDDDGALPPFRVPTVADVAAVSGMAPEAARAALLARCVDAALDEETARRVESAMAEADPLADITLSLSCAHCGGLTEASIDPVGEVLARVTDPSDLVEDVHALALAYGWTETDVLALPRSRRHDYLVLVADLAS
jgi:hypothetical protein